MQYRYLAPAKLNLTLDVLNKRPDGYHDIRSIFQSIALADELVIRPTAAEGDTLAVSGPEAAGVPADASNIVMKAITAMRAAVKDRGAEVPALRVDLVKQIPSQAGLGGGSSDAAAAMLGVAAISGIDFSRQEMTAVAASVGADAPYFLTGGTCLVEGLGEQVSALPCQLPQRHVVILKPPAGVSTAAAYAALDSVPKPEVALIAHSEANRRIDGDILMSNDFERVVFAQWPVIGYAQDVAAKIAAQWGAREPRLCGSGACLFTLRDEERQAEEIAEQLSLAGVGKVWKTHTISGGSRRVE